LRSPYQDHPYSKGANTISSYAQTYDAGSKITGVTGTDGISTYAYDDTNQLTGADYDFQADESYSYDSNGNRTIATFTLNADEHLEAASPPLPAPITNKS
jgi:YD repeat-containing protein